MKVFEARMVYKMVREGDNVAVDSPLKVCEYLDGMFDEDPTVESLVVILLNRKNHPLGRVRIASGTATACLVHPREVFKPAITASATAVVVAHNHPSGDPSPSSADVQITRVLKEAAGHIQIDLMDHIIIGHPDPMGRPVYYSFAESGLL